MTLIWDRIVATQRDPTSVVLVGSFLAALALVWARAAWEVTRHAVTIVHEGAHGVAATLSGRRLAGIRLHSDSSGVTVSSGRSTGPGMVATAASGYLGPAILGLACAGLLATGHAVAVLWLLLLCLALLVIQIRNFFGLAAVLVSGAVVYVVTWQLDQQAQVAAAYVVTWFLLIAAPRPVLELQSARRGGRAPGSDADQLARLTRVPALVWVGVFLVVNVAVLVFGAGLLLKR